MQKWESICLEQFQLTYYGHISYEAIEEMSIYERSHFYKLLVDTKKEEREAHKEAIEKANSRR